MNRIILPLPGYSRLDLLFKRKGGLLVESLPNAVSSDSAEMIPGRSAHLLVVHFLISKEEELVLLLGFFACCML